MGGTAGVLTDEENFPNNSPTALVVNHGRRRPDSEKPMMRDGVIVDAILRIVDLREHITRGVG
jgi:hypothetical protein